MPNLGFARSLAARRKAKKATPGGSMPMGTGNVSPLQGGQPSMPTASGRGFRSHLSRLARRAFGGR